MSELFKNKRKPTWEHLTTPLQVFYVHSDGWFSKEPKDNDAPIKLIEEASHISIVEQLEIWQLITKEGYVWRYYRGTHKQPIFGYSDSIEKAKETVEKLYISRRKVSLERKIKNE